MNVCPAGVASVPPDRVWDVLSATERFGEWNDATFVSSEPSGPMQAGQVIHLTAPALGRQWRVEIQVRDADPQHRWVDLRVRLPFGIVNQERVTLIQTKEGGTCVRFN